MLGEETSKIFQKSEDLTHLNCSDLQAYLGDIAGLVPDDGNKAAAAIQ